MTRHPLAILAFALACGTPAATASAEGVVLVGLTPGLAAETLDLRVGDRLLRWEQGADSGGLASPFDLAELDLERGPRGPVKLTGLRGEQPIAVTLFPDDWGIRARPALPAALAGAHDAALRAADSGKLEEALAGLGRMRAPLRDLAGTDLEPWLLLEIARLEGRRRRTDESAAALEEGAGIARAGGRSAVEAQLLRTLYETFREADRLDAAAQALDRSLAVRRQHGGTLATAALAEQVGMLAFARGGNTADALKAVAEAAAVLQREAPDSLAHARVRRSLGWLQGHPDGLTSFALALSLVDRLAPESVAAAVVLRAAAWTERDPAQRLLLITRALRILERLAPESREMVNVLSARASILIRAGDLQGALDHYRRAVAIIERIGPGSQQHATLLNNLGGFWAERGDLIEAEALYRRALEIDERLAPGSVWVGTRLYNLGDLLARRRDYEQAETVFARTLEIVRRSEVSGPLLGRILYQMADLRQARGDAAGAEAALRESLEVVTRKAPGQVAQVQRRLAAALAESGRYAEAEALYRENLERAEKYVRDGGHPGLALAEGHRDMGLLAWRRGDAETAERHYRAAIDLRRAQARDTIDHAESSHDLALVAQRLGRWEEALALFQEAVAALETQARKLGGSEEVRTRYRDHYQRYYRDLEELLLKLGRPREAFEVVERARARGLLALLASRDLALGGEVPPELERDRRRADGDHDRLFRALQAPSLDDAAREKLGRELNEARQAQEDARARIRVSAPRSAALRDPEPLDLAGVRSALAPGALLLAFSLGAESGSVYAVGPGPDEFAVEPLAAGSEWLRDEVRGFRQAIDAHRSRLQRSAIASRSRRLTEKLLRPVAGRLRRASSVVIVPDAALHVLPFAALMDPGAPGERYLVESTSVQVVSSVTLYETLARVSRPGGPEAHAVGFGDPAYPAGSSVDAPALTRARSSGLRLRPLPASRGEIEALRSLSPDAQLWTGAAATEEKAKSVGRDTRFLHFACHGFLDERFPLESGLALAIPGAPAPGQENGFLQAWEVFEGMRLDADLLTLSACQTGLGHEMAGEGLLGLTWAFQYAGARSVLASLWEVSDTSTAELMKRLYRHLAAGVPRAEALRRAQVDLLRRRTTAAPYFWAAFTLFGDGR